MDKVKLSEIFQDYNPKYILGTTYSLSLTFFEAVVYPHINKENLHHCLILCDQFGFKQAITELSAVSGIGCEYLISVAPTSFTFHPKIWLLVEDHRIGVLVGSGNLTQSGFIENVELFDFFELSSSKENSIEIANDVIIFLDGLINIWNNYETSNLIVMQILQKILKHVKDLSTGFVNKESSIRLLSNFNGGIAEKLPTADKLFVASPFFGGTVEGLKELKNSIKASKVYIFPAIHRDNSVDIPIEDLSSVGNVTCLKCEYIEKKGFHHLKLFGGISDNQKWLFTGSANCTLAAIYGDNIEVGLLRKNYFSEEYFKGEEFPEKLPLRKEEHNDSTGYLWLQVECDDNGRSLIFTVSKSNKHLLPLKDAVVTIKLMQQRKSVQKTMMFNNGNTEDILWSEFGIDNDKENSCYVTIRGISLTGKHIEGVAIANNIHVVNLGPQEKRAYRAVLNFFSGDQLPDNSDLSAVFGLLDNIDNFEKNEIINIKLNNPKKEEESSERDMLALWPPISSKTKAITHNNQYYVSGISICQKVLGILLADSASSPSKIIVQDQEDDEGDIRVIEKKVQVRMKTLIEQSEEWFTDTMETYRSFEPSSFNYGFVWGKIIYATLIHILIAKKALAVIKHPALRVLENIVAAFIRTMFSWRIQESSRPGLYKRYKGLGFPPLAVDLKEKFSWIIDEDIGAVVFLFFLFLYYQRKKQASFFPIVEFLLFQELYPNSYDTQKIIRLKNVFSRYIKCEADFLDWTELENSIDPLTKLSWNDVEALKFVKEIIAKHPNAGIVYVEPGCFYCLKSGCRNAYMQNPELRDLKRFFPAFCSSCGSILVPLIYKGKTNGI